MAEETSVEENKCKRRKGMDSCGNSGAIYGLAFIGSLVYYIQHATSFWGIVMGVLKSAVWPAMLIYKALEYLKM